MSIFSVRPKDTLVLHLRKRKRKEEREMERKGGREDGRDGGREEGLKGGRERERGRDGALNTSHVCPRH